MLYLKPNLNYTDFIKIFIDLLFIIIDNDINIPKLQLIFIRIFDLKIKKNKYQLKDDIIDLLVPGADINSTSDEILVLKNDEININEKFKEEFGINNLIEIYKIII